MPKPVVVQSKSLSKPQAFMAINTRRKKNTMLVASKKMKNMQALQSRNGVRQRHVIYSMLHDSLVHCRMHLINTKPIEKASHSWTNGYHLHKKLISRVPQTVRVDWTLQNTNNGSTKTTKSTNYHRLCTTIDPLTNLENVMSEMFDLLARFQTTPDRP